MWAPITSDGSSPAARSFHSAIVVGKKILFIGGTDSPKVDVFDTGNLLHWIELIYEVEQKWEEGPSQTPIRSKHSCVYFEELSQICCFGGEDKQGLHNDIFTLDIGEV